jgi:cytochrome c oxidase cbb3-type subunit II
VNHAIFEKNSLILLLGVLIVISIGGIIEIAPLFMLNSTIEKVQGMRPYSPLELAGRDIYVREGCYNCHSQMIRSIRDEVERYGHYSLAAESMYDHPFQWSSKRTGPDLARVGGKFSDGWHVDHMRDPRSVVPASIMPSYAWLEQRPLDYSDIAERLSTLKLIGVPYTDDMIKNAKADVEAQIAPDSKGAKDVLARYPKAQIRKFDGNMTAGASPSELDAMIAYLQMLGTLVDFTKYDASGPNLR